jgi:hypothetical protein
VERGSNARVRERDGEAVRREGGRGGGVKRRGLGAGKGLEIEEGGKLSMGEKDGDDNGDNDEDAAKVHVVQVLGTPKEAAKLTAMGGDASKEDAKQFPLNLGTYEKRPGLQTVHLFEFRSTAPERAEFAAGVRVNTALPHTVHVGQLCTPVTTNVELIMWSPDKSAQLNDLQLTAEVPMYGATASSATSKARGILGGMSLSLTGQTAGPTVNAQFSNTATRTNTQGVSVDRLELKASNFGKDDGAQSLLPGGRMVPASKSGTFHVARRLVTLGGSFGWTLSTGRAGPTVRCSWPMAFSCRPTLRVKHSWKGVVLSVGGTS